MYVCFVQRAASDWNLHSYANRFVHNADRNAACECNLAVFSAVSSSCVYGFLIILLATICLLFFVAPRIVHINPAVRIPVVFRCNIIHVSIGTVTCFRNA